MDCFFVVDIVWEYVMDNKKIFLHPARNILHSDRRNSNTELI